MNRPPFACFVAGVLFAVSLFGGRAGLAEVVRLEIQHREPFAEGHCFGHAGAYEKIVGRLHLEVDPNDPANERVVDLKLAPRNAGGKVEFWTDFFLLAPADPKRGNRRLIHGVNNRGNKLMLGALNGRGGNNPSTLADAGNGFLMREGYSILWCGWNGDILPGGDRLLIHLPVASENGKSITGKIYTEICVDAKCLSQPLCPANSDPYPAVSLDNGDAQLTARPTRAHAAIEVPRDQWSFARWEDGKAVPDPKHIYLKEGFQPGWLYELVYVGKDPRVTGLGLAAVRDVVSFFRYEAADAAGNANPLAGAVDRAYVFGISQSGRFIHHFIYEGFNVDPRRRAVFDAAMPHVAGGGRGSFNHRFAQTTRYGSQHEENGFPCDMFPFTSAPEKDPVTGEEGDTLSYARSRGPVPKMFFTQTSAEYWCRAASLLHTDVAGARDIALDPDVRIYFIAGAQHVVSSSDRGIHKYPHNTLDHTPALRALLVALDRWASAGEAPPESRYPRIADGTLVDLATYRRTFPPMAGVQLPEGYRVPARLDFGPRWASEGIADHAPPRFGEPYRPLLPAVDADGNAVAGIRLPEVAVPLATYTGWNLRDAACGAEGMLARFHGSLFPLSRTPDERRQTADRRPSILERYPRREDYVAKVAAAAVELKRERFLLDEDVVRIVEAALRRAEWDPEKP
ncbi:MAG: alpha/beta hydrolase domain-containing protein [Planctomycetia bacterium]|nr:alpha/beta hydrolase domain-containing protein [Planctomycetia bacterium]